MGKNKRKIDYHEHDTPGEEIFPNRSNVASVNECTGLMYRTPVDDHELESYQHLSSMEIPKDAQNGDDSVTHKLLGDQDLQKTKEAVKEASNGLSSI